MKMGKVQKQIFVSVEINDNNWITEITIECLECK